MMMMTMMMMMRTDGEEADGAVVLERHAAVQTVADRRRQEVGVCRVGAHSDVRVGQDRSQWTEADAEARARS